MDETPFLDPEILDELADEFARRIRNGERPTIIEYQRQYPEHANEIAEFLHSVAELENYREEQVFAYSSASRLQREFAALERLGDYRIVGEIGRGGMGLVLEAIHESLGRRVAIKVLPQSHADDKTRLARFQREARAAARLHHPHIVPVFGVGESHGFAYYVMELVRGRSLHEVVQQLGSNAPTRQDQARTLRELGRSTRRTTPPVPADDRDTIEAKTELPGDAATLPSATHAKEVGGDASSLAPSALFTRQHYNWVAKIGSQVASALAYAHGEGVLHRDIKPANLLLNEQEQVLITDFGLAKHSADAGLSMTGEIVGTPRYMPPEFLEGKADERSDVYGLGITLYELLLLKPAFDDAPPAQMMRSILESTPTAPRRVHAAIPRDLETIILKAIERDPAKRYRAAHDFERDLRLFLADQPIEARRVSLSERAWRWARRNPAVASLTAVSFLLLAGIAAVMGIGNWQLGIAFQKVQQAQQQVDAELAEKRAALVRVEKEKSRAETNVDLAMQAFEQVMTNIASRRIDPMMALADGESEEAVVPSTLTTADIRLLETLLEFFDRFASENQKDFRVESAYARVRVGDIQQQLGRYREAQQTYQAALEDFEQLAIERVELDAFVLERVRILNELARNASWQGSMARAGLYSKSSQDLLEKHPDVLAQPEGKFELAQTCWLYASAGARSGLTSMLEVMLPRTRRIAEGRDQELRFFARTRPQLNERQAELVATLRQAVDLLTELIDNDPQNVSYQITLARCYREQARIVEAMNMSRVAARAVTQSAQILQGLVEAFPDSLSLKYELAETLCLRVESDRSLAQRTNRAERLIGQLNERNPAMIEFQMLEGTLLRNQGFLSREIDNLDAAAEYYAKAAGVQQAICEQQPNRLSHQIAAAQTLVEWVQVEVERGNLELALTRLDQAIQHLEGDTGANNRRVPRVSFLRPSIQRLREWRRRLDTKLREGEMTESSTMDSAIQR